VLHEPVGQSVHTPVGDSESLPVMSLIIAAGRPGPALADRLEAFRHSTLAYSTEMVVACDSPWSDPPPGVRVVVTPSASRGDRLDRACEEARGELLAFVQEDVRLSEGWQRRAIELLRDPAIGAVGGPDILPVKATGGQRAAWLVLSSIFGAGPLRFRFQRRPARLVLEMPTTNLVVRQRAFKAVGGYQCPSPLGDDARLCYKLRSILGLRVVYDPGLAVEAPLPALPQPFLSLMFEWGRQRGDLTRRLPETSRPIPYLLPPIALLTGLLAIGLMPFSLAARVALGLLVGAYVLAGVWIVARSGNLRSGLLAGVGLPLTHVYYAIGFLRGFVGRSLGEVSPRPHRNTPLRILIFNWRDIAHPWAGGAEAYMHELGRRWVRAGCEVGWVSERYRSAKTVEIIDGIRFHRVGSRFTLYPLAALACLLRLRSRYDVIVDCENGIPFFTPLYCRKPVVLVIHHLHQEIFRQELPLHLRWLALWLEGWLMPRVYRRSVMVTVSPSTFEDLRAHGYDPGRIVTVTNGVDVPEAKPGIHRSPSPVLIYLGRLKKYKSVDVLLRAMPDVLSYFPDASLAIVGQGTERDVLERLVWKLGLAKSVKFYGYLDKENRDRLLAMAWVAVCTSKFEGWGVVCLEANAHGTPVVASRVPGLRDAVQDGLTGVLVPYGNSERLAKEIVSLLGDPVRREAMARAGREWAAAHAWNRSADQFLKTIATVASAHGLSSGILAPYMDPSISQP